MSKVVLVISDGLRDDTAAEQMGYLEHLVVTKQATRYTVLAELPTVSRVLYETIHTGQRPSQHGITSNLVVRPSTQPNIFSLARQHGRITAAAASHWFSELYNTHPYDPVEHSEVNDPTLPIQHGRFYFSDPYPDFELFSTATLLLRRYQPDYLLIHPISVDGVGEAVGSQAAAYSRQVESQDEILGLYLPDWLKRGYTVLVTADHGMDGEKSHGGAAPGSRRVPLYMMHPGQAGLGNTDATVSQLRIAPTVLTLMGVPIPETMTEPPIPMS